jgi:hypothetical protein
LDELVAVSVSGSLGWLPCGEVAFREALDRGPSYIGAQHGSSDCGPLYLGAEVPYAVRKWEKHDLELMLTAGLALGVPVIIGGAGGMGTRKGVDRTVQLVREIAGERGLHFTLAKIYSDQDPEYLVAKLREGAITPLGITSPLREEDIWRSAHTVAMMGVEPIISALERGAEVIIAGRCTDPAIYAAVPIWRGFDPGLAWYMGKILECGCLSAEPPSLTDANTGRIRVDHVFFEPGDPMRRCTVASVASHSLYERANPWRQLEPGGILDLTGLELEQVSDRAVRATGAVFLPRPYTVKLEGAARVGYRAFAICGTRDPMMIAEIDSVVERLKSEVYERIPGCGSDYRLFIHLYGKNAIMGPLEPVRETGAHELCIMVQVVGRTEELAIEVAEMANHLLFDLPYKGQKTTAGNVAFFGSLEVFIPQYKEVYEYIIDHEMHLDDPLECFSIHMERV